MASQSATKSWSGYLDHATRLLTWVGALCLLAIVVIVAVGVVMRYVFSAPIMGVNEIVQLAAVALVMSALPYCTAQNGHVTVDVFDEKIGRTGRLVGDVTARLLSIFTLGVLCQRATGKALDALEWGDATNMLGMPIWPFYGMLAAGSALCILVFASQLVLLFMEGDRP
jgi:TRAP-type transport system small permease protein